MENLFNEKDRENLLKRLAKLDMTSQALWGTMSAHQMIVHLADPLRVALGDRPVPYYPNFLGEPPLNIEISQVKPWIKDAPTVPEWKQDGGGTVPTNFTDDYQSLLSLIDRFARHDNSIPFPLHPLFNNLNNDQWARVMWRHIDHHLNQFGV